MLYTTRRYTQVSCTTASPLAATSIIALGEGRDAKNGRRASLKGLIVRVVVTVRQADKRPTLSHKGVAAAPSYDLRVVIARLHYDRTMHDLYKS